MYYYIMISCTFYIMTVYQFILWASYVSINVYHIINSFSVYVLTSSLVCVCWSRSWVSSPARRVTGLQPTRLAFRRVKITPLLGCKSSHTCEP